MPNESMWIIFAFICFVLHFIVMCIIAYHNYKELKEQQKLCELYLSSIQKVTINDV